MRKFNTSRKPSSVVGILDEAVRMLANRGGRDSPALFVPVPRNDCERVSLRVTGQSYELAQAASQNADVRITDWLRTAVILYLHKHGKEISPIRLPKGRARDK